MTVHRLDQWLRSQLAGPEPLGVDLALLRTRLYRFSAEHDHYLLAEELERRYLAAAAGSVEGAPALGVTASQVQAWLAHMRAERTAPAIPSELLASLGVDAVAERERRAEHTARSAGPPPSRYLIILGAPRSGTSHLHNLLASTGSMAYLTTASCWAWPTYQLDQPHQRHFQHLLPDALDVDNKRTRIIPGLVAPGEAEDLFHRCLPVYRRHRGHDYELALPAPVVSRSARQLFRSAAGAHRAHFRRDTLLLKSPFHAFRIPQLERLCATARVAYLHITRDHEACSESIRRNGFSFSQNGERLTAADAHDLFTATIRDAVPAERCLPISFERLRDEPARTLRELREWYLDALGRPDELAGPRDGQRTRRR